MTDINFDCADLSGQFGAPYRQLPIQLLPESPGSEVLLKFRLQLLEAKLARQTLQTDFAERIDVDHYAWRQLQTELRYLKTINVILICVTISTTVILLAAAIWLFL